MYLHKSFPDLTSSKKVQLKHFLMPYSENFVKRFFPEIQSLPSFRIKPKTFSSSCFIWLCVFDRFFCTVKNAIMCFWWASGYIFTSEWLVAIISFWILEQYFVWTKRIVNSPLLYRLLLHTGGSKCSSNFLQKVSIF